MRRTKILLVDDDEDDIFLTRNSLESQNYEVVTASSVTQALKHIAAQRFDVLITDLHMPEPGDGFAVVTAMRHFQPDVLNLVCSSYPDVQKSMAAILLQADQVLTKPFEADQLAALVTEKKLTSRPSAPVPKEGVAAILDRNVAITIQRWLARVQLVPGLAALSVSNNDRTKYLPAMMAGITARLRANRAIEAEDRISATAAAHGQIRYAQGYTAPLIVEESRMLQVCIFETIDRNLSTVDFTKVLPDIMIIADEVDCQLKQTIESFLTMQRGGAALAGSA